MEAGQARAVAEDGRYGHHARRNTLRIESATAIAIPASTPRNATARNAAIESDELGLPLMPEPHDRPDIGQRERRRDDDGGERWLRQVPQQPGSHEDHEDRGGADDTGQLGLRSCLFSDGRP